MFLSLLNQKETLKFLDLAIYMVDIDGEPTEIEKNILEKMFREVGHVVNEYSFKFSDSIEETVNFFEKNKFFGYEKDKKIFFVL